MTADTEMIRKALYVLYAYTSDNANPPGAGRSVSYAEARAALGRVEERGRTLTEALRRIDFTAGNILRVVEFAKDDAETLAGVTFVNATDIRAFARAALAGSVAAGSGEERE